MSADSYPAVIVVLALLLDWRLGEPQRYHPLVGFGYIADFLVQHFYAPTRTRGLLLLLLVLLPPCVIAVLLCRLPYGIGTLFSLGALYFAVGHKSLHDHVRPIVLALRAGDKALARAQVAQIVSRDAATLEIIPSSCESVLENGNDAVFGALFWFMCAGAPGVILYRLSNTLDAMWGYKNERYFYFGWAAARLDDFLNYLPARLTALTYALLGKTRLALRCWQEQAPLWDSPNAGPVMAAGAGALDVRLGGAAVYHGAYLERPSLGTERAPDIEDITRALALVRHGVVLWLALFAFAHVLFYGLYHGFA